MLLPESIEYAPDWVRAHALGMRPGARFVAVILMHGEVSARAHPILRDRTDEVVAMLRGLAGDLEAEVIHEERAGRDWKAFGFEPEGAQHIHVYRMLVL